MGMSKARKITTLLFSITLFSGLLLFSGIVISNPNSSLLLDETNASSTSTMGIEASTFIEKVLNRVDRLKRDLKSFMVKEYEKKVRGSDSITQKQIKPADYKESTSGFKRLEAKESFPDLTKVESKKNKKSKDSGKKINVIEKPKLILADDLMLNSISLPSKIISEHMAPLKVINLDTMAQNNNIQNNNISKENIKKINISDDEIKSIASKAIELPNSNAKENILSPNNMINLIKTIEKTFQEHKTDNIDDIDMDEDKIFNFQTPTGDVQIRRVVLKSIDQNEPIGLQDFKNNQVLDFKNSKVDQLNSDDKKIGEKPIFNFNNPLNFLKPLSLSSGLVNNNSKKDLAKSAANSPEEDQDERSAAILKIFDDKKTFNSVKKEAENKLDSMQKAVKEPAPLILPRSLQKDETMKKVDHEREKRDLKEINHKIDKTIKEADVKTLNELSKKDSDDKKSKKEEVDKKNELKAKSFIKSKSDFVDKFSEVPLKIDGKIAYLKPKPVNENNQLKMVDQLKKVFKSIKDDFIQEEKQRNDALKKSAKICQTD